jgi:hypothetical protein
MTGWLYSAQEVAAPHVYLNPGAKGSRQFAVVALTADRLTTMTFHTAKEALAMRDACQRAADLLAEAEGTAS